MSVQSLIVNAGKVNECQSNEALIREGRCTAETMHMRLVGVCHAVLPWSGHVASYILAPSGEKGVRAL